MASGPSVLETPSYVCALVFAIFLLVSLFLDKAIHKAKHALSKWKRKGLKTAFDHIVMEMMLLGFISLVLLVFESDITQICVPKHSRENNWVLISRIDPCHPCLANTRQMSYMYKENSHCPFWDNGLTHASVHKYSTPTHHEDDLHDLVPEHGIEMKNTEDTGHGRRLMGGEGGGASVCEDGKEQLFSASVLHQLHIFMFLLGVTHVMTSTVMIIVASARMSLCNAYEEDEHHRCVTDRIQQGTVGYVDSRSNPAGLMSLDVGDDEMKIDKIKEIKFSWTAADRNMNKFKNVVIEYVISFFKQFIKPVSIEEYNLMRASFMLTHRRTANFVFMDYITAGLDDDFSEVVSINLSRGLSVVLFILLLPPTDWTGWISTFALVIFMCLPLIVTTKLLYIVRHVTRGGRVHTLSESVFWFGNPRLLLPVINFMLFTISTVYATAIFFAWQFGPKSCFFYGRSPSADLSDSDWTWVIMLVATTGAFIHLSVVTLPTYSLVVNMGRVHWHKDLVPENVRESLFMLAKQVKKKIKAEASTPKSGMATSSERRELSEADSMEDSTKRSQDEPVARA